MNKRRVEKIITGQATTDGAGVKLVRMIGQPEFMDLDPFLLLDAFRSDDPDAYIAGFPLHPHRGFETVTYLLNGRIRHKDNAGNEGVIEPGGIQWMTAGKGIVHSEMPEQEDGLLEGFQLWINLPGSHKMSPPAYQEFDTANIPVESRPGTTIKVISGETDRGTRGPVTQPLTEPLYLDVSLEPDTSFDESIAADRNGFVYVISGELLIEDIEGKPLKLTADQLAVLGQGDRIELRAGGKPVRFLLVAGKPLNEPIVRGGPFVMNTEAEISQAFRDFKQGNL